MTKFLGWAAAMMMGLATVAAADPLLTVMPTSVHPGDAVLVTVTGAPEVPKGKAGGRPLAFFAAKGGHQAVFAVPLHLDEDHVLVEVPGAHFVSIPILPTVFPETSIVVEDDLANPDAAERARIEADNGAMTTSYARAPEEPQFTRPFRRPPGKMTSPFGEWRKYNDEHRSQHLGMDLHAREGSKVVAIADGTVVLVRDTFLAGNVVVVGHGGHIASLYFHLSKASVAEGDTVKQGDVVGLAGHTGRTTGPHLHLSIHVEGGLVDPVSFFKLPLAPALAAAPAPAKP